MKIHSLAVPTLLAISAAHGPATVLLSENFNSLALGPYVSPTESGGDGTDWTATAPAGWVKDQGATPVGNPVEFFGWTFHDRTAWIATEGDQDRSVWTGGTGTVMVADPDAYDDGTNIDTGLYNVSILTPVISLVGLIPNSMTISLASSFRAEATQIATLDVSFNGGAFTNLHTYDGNTLPDAQLFNDPISKPVANGAVGTAQFRFSLTNASNDWWWAIDDVVISADQIPEPSTALLALIPLLGFARRRRS
jgi:hypothetical protein